MHRRIRGKRKTLIQLLLTAVEGRNGRYFLRLKVRYIFNCPVWASLSASFNISRVLCALFNNTYINIIIGV